MFRQRTSAAFAVFSFPGIDPRHGVPFCEYEGPRVGLPHVRCLLADQYGIGGAGSGRVSSEPLIRGSCSGLVPPFSSLEWRVREDGPDLEVERPSRSVSESEL